MKSTKSLFAILSFVALSFACASVTETPVTTSVDQPVTISITDDAAFSGGNDMKPIISKPKI